MNFSQLLWNSYSIETLRGIAFSGEFLESYSKRAKREIIKRTQNQKIDDIR